MANDFSTPVVLVVFNRPECTRKMLEQVRAVKPRTILIVADGPRKTHSKDRELCAATRAVLEEGIDWNPTVLTNYSPVNLGCRQRVSSGLNWAFEFVNEAIILEDDCIADPSFFPFCAELLAFYQNDLRVGVITGNNFQPAGFSRDSSYYFSKYPHCWGWATWKRAWKHYDDTMAQWPRLKSQNWLRGLFPDKFQALYWEMIFGWVDERKISSWAYPWTFCCWSQNMLSIIPSVNLVSNIGSGPDATHTSDPGEWVNLPTFPMRFPLSHPPVMTPDFPADDYSQRTVYGLGKPKTLKGKFQRILSRWIS